MLISRLFLREEIQMSPYISLLADVQHKNKEDVAQGLEEQTVPLQEVNIQASFQQKESEARFSNTQARSQFKEKYGLVVR